MSLSFITLGVGDAFSALRYSSCLAVEAEGQVLLIDCPHPIRKMMREASESSGVPLDADRVAGVALTHLHADHSSGLEGLSYFSFFLLKQKLSLLCHPEVARR
ncbi:MBL fold metallo-hydrolase, partial [Stigmatella aurantiaca]